MAQKRKIFKKFWTFFLSRPKSEFLFLRHLFASRPKTFSNGILYEVGRHNDDDDDDNDDDDVIAKRRHLKVTDTLESR